MTHVALAARRRSAAGRHRSTRTSALITRLAAGRRPGPWLAAAGAHGAPRARAHTPAAAKAQTSGQCEPAYGAGHTFFATVSRAIPRSAISVSVHVDRPWK